MSPGSSTESYPAFAQIGLRKNPGKNLNQVGNTAERRDLDSIPGQVWVEFVVDKTEVAKYFSWDTTVSRFNSDTLHFLLTSSIICNSNNRLGSYLGVVLVSDAAGSTNNGPPVSVGFTNAVDDWSTCLVTTRLCKAWLEALGRYDLMVKEPNKLHNSFRVCADHFEEKYFTSTLRTRLNKGAIPCKVEAISNGQDMEWEQTGDPSRETGDPPREESQCQETGEPPRMQPTATPIVTPKRRKIRSLRVQLHRLRGRVLKTTQRSED
ncbi:hypothetical protein ANN_18583 [Periplaneta americana]|uniref:THAP-type domain-containing protein n=1 Tax=Periplaneta americana TaxID=6978 RepID=A0ABQ8SR88_PERAM|nr:hypothetical protein ANN_18583 [Periplaneta americana]